MSNDKDFVPYSIALELKQLGFDEPCFGCYDEKGVFGLTVMSIKQYYINIKEDTWNCSAPLYQQAFRWFREKYGIKHMIFAGKISTVFYGYDLLHIEEQEFVVNNSDNGGGDCDYTTYEEAEQACLIKLIEICKTKNNEQTN
jgi:hypothetical protein